MLSGDNAEVKKISPITLFLEVIRKRTSLKVHDYIAITDNHLSFPLIEINISTVIIDLYKNVNNNLKLTAFWLFLLLCCCLVFSVSRARKATVVILEHIR